MALQADHPGEAAARPSLLAGRDRLAAVALIYRLVQHESDLVDFARFTHELGRILLESHQRPAGAITIEPLFSGVLLPQRLAITLGLILGELLTASLAWSFPDPNATGHIRLTLTTGGNEGILILRDNGQPHSAAIRTGREASFSCRLVELLAGQAGGSLTWLSDLENQVRLRFSLRS
jgi:two-component sensor histidine kinase